MNSSTILSQSLTMYPLISAELIRVNFLTFLEKRVSGCFYEVQQDQKDGDRASGPH